MRFLTDTRDWLLEKRSSHMGAHQYVAHKGLRDGQKTSGALLWEESEKETLTTLGNMVNAETMLLQTVVSEIRQFVPLGTAIVELGPGTVPAFRNKTLPICKKIESNVCVLVDESVAFLTQIIEVGGLGNGLKIMPVIDDFLDNLDNVEISYYDGEAVVCSFGSTIGNILNPVSDQPPQLALIDALSKIARAAHSGWMLIGLDSDQDGERIKEFYKSQALFQLNIFDRMAAELPIERAFDPKVFVYEPEWIASSGQLAHVAIVTRDMDFTLDGRDITLKQGQRLHIKNSYKYTPEFFEECCAFTGLEIVKVWANDSPSKIYLLKIPPKLLALRPAPTMKPTPQRELQAA